jgi:glutamyl-tRNA(Gln) amidotransferase subunit D
MNDTIAVLHTGGTIASALNGGMLAVGGQAQKNLEGLLDRFQERSQFHLAQQEICSIDSAEMTYRPLRKLLADIAEKAKGGITRFMVTHGTDSLHYTAAILDHYFGRTPLSICLVAASYPLHHQRSDGPSHVEAALAILGVAQPRAGVMIPFSEDPYARGRNRAIRIHTADALLPMAYDETVFRSTGNASLACMQLASLVEGTKTVPFATHHGPIPPIPDEAAFDAALDRVIGPLQVSPDLRLDFIDRKKAKNMVLVLGAFHSGTAPAVTHVIIGFAQANPRSRVMLGSLPAHLNAAPYEPTVRLMQAGIPVYSDEIAPHYIRARMVAGLADGHTPERAMQALDGWRVRLRHHQPA